MAGERTDQQCHMKLISAVARHYKSEAASHVAANLAGVLLRATPGTPQTQVHLIAAKECIENIQVSWQKIDGAPVIGDASCRREPGQARATAPAPERMRESVGGGSGGRREVGQRQRRRVQGPCLVAAVVLVRGDGWGQGRGGLSGQRGGSRLAAAPTGAVALVAGGGGDVDFSR